LSIPANSSAAPAPANSSAAKPIQVYEEPVPYLKEPALEPRDNS